METQQTKGFEMRFDTPLQVLRVRAWGDWTPEFARRCERVVLDRINKCSARGRPWHVLLELPGLSPTAEEVWDILHRQMLSASAKGMAKLVYLGEKTDTHLRLHTLLLDSHLPQYAFAESEADALQWIERGLPPRKHDDVNI